MDPNQSGIGGVQPGNDQNGPSRLGRGLESLIPQRRPPQDAAPNVPTPVGGQAQSLPIQPAPSLIQDLEHAHPTEHVAEELPVVAKPAEEPRQPIILTPPIEPPVITPQTQPQASVAVPHVSNQTPDTSFQSHSDPAVRHVSDQAGGSSKKYADAVFQIETDKIVPNPDQPRRMFEPEALKELAASIREFGLLQPLVVTKIEREVPTGTVVQYQLISGERRWQASKLLGLPRVPVVIRNLTYNRESLELAVIENIQRENLNPIELARAYARLQDEFRLTQREVASRLGKSRETVANTVRLLDLPPEIQEALQQNLISESHGRLLLTIDDLPLQQRLFRDLLENRMTTRELQSRARAGRPKREREIVADVADGLGPELKFLQERLSSTLGAPVSIHQNGGSGRITINYYSEEELQNILNHLGTDGG